MKPDFLTVGAILGNLVSAIAFVEDAADLSALDAGRKQGLLIAVEEAFVNICNYAYQQDSGDVTISCRNDAALFVVEISDHGRPFDILSVPDPDTTSELMDRQAGGLGVHFIRKLTDEATYRRDGGRNILRLALHNYRTTVS